MTTPQSPAGLTECTEQKRLNDAREKGIPWKKWGPYLSERQWGTVREDYSADGNAWDYFTHDQSRSRTYRWGEDGIGGLSDDKQLPLLRARALEREGPDPQGAALRPHEQRGEPRRGRQGVLLLRRLDADALVHEVPLQVPAGGVPVPRPPRDEPPAVARGDGVRAARHRRVPRGPVLRRLPRGRQGRPGGPPDPRLRPQPRARSRRGSHLLPTLWFRNTWSWDGGDVEAAPRGSGAGKDPRGAFRAGHVRARVRREPGAPLHGEREQRRASLGPAEPDPVREGRVPPVRRRRRDGRGESGEGGHEGRGPVRPRRAGGRVRRRPAPPRGGAPGRPVRQGRSTRSSRRVSPTPTSSTTRSRRAR